MTALWSEGAGGALGSARPVSADRGAADLAASDLAAPELPSQVDVAIVGAGFTGLWTAYHLLTRRPEARVAVLEAEHVGFGASGRNGGWVSALYPVGPTVLARRHGAEGARAMFGALREVVEDLGAIVEAEGIDCGYVRGGSIAVARNAAQAKRALAEVAESDEWGLGTRWLDRDEAHERLSAADTLGATFTPHCARVHPRALVDGLAEAVRRRGGTIHEGVRVADAAAGRVVLASGQVIRATQIVRATEAYGARLPRLRRSIAPVYSLMVATEPLSPQMWATIGLERRETFSDHRHLIIYGQRTVDDRIAFGGRGAPYHRGSAISPAFDRDEAVFAELRRTLLELLPQLGDVSFTHAWGGPLGIARDWHPSVAYDASSGVARAGGYVGDGVAATQLAGATLADLLCGLDTPRTRLPWVGHRSPDWEPEPLRWAGINAGLRLASLADREEQLTGRPAVVGRVLSRLTSH
ncbi:NAD(P)/FAD-dependent oxidoreductase [Janibacter sp. G56]|uniref:NAD(P)/FAD-dependent oxidoreductase n=1 Tax=Janibacter sp. G56 TaxID=3418717 RepID=UPI003D08E8A5